MFIGVGQSIYGCAAHDTANNDTRSLVQNSCAPATKDVGHAFHPALILLEKRRVRHGQRLDEKARMNVDSLSVVCAHCVVNVKETFVSFVVR